MMFSRQKFTELSTLLFRVSILIYVFVAGCFYLNIPVGIGDEVFYINEIEGIERIGLLQKITEGLSIPHAIITYPMYLIGLPAFVALRLGSLLVLLVLLYYFIRCYKQSVYFIFLFLFFVFTTGFFFIGTNDAIFIGGLVLFFSEFLRFLFHPKQHNYSLMLSAVLVSFFTRELIFIYLPVILIFTVYITYFKRPKLKDLKVPIALLLLFFTLNTPSLLIRNSLSYELKVPSKNIMATWSQRHYYAQLLANENKIPEGAHPTWQKTDDYLLEHGMNSLPKSIIASITFDWRLTFYEFFKDLYYSIYYSIRQLGLSFLIVGLVGVKSLWEVFKNKAKIKSRHGVNILFALLFYGMLALFSFIIISYFELRWIAPISIITLLFFSLKLQQKEISPSLVLLNTWSIIFMCIYGLKSFL